ncbi:MAG: hypothetical protein CO093_03985 [Alphaproteobacteria bacterium CG_4_9_14_3_um_filter_47_13]|nr:MAG: hypothetical protein CO093_03985 [Alphaproteobacteria bacterium CG_4_9_14_3_um_filter_47_13]
MSREYAEERIREALKLSKGNSAKARQRVIAWTSEDPKLLQALAKPHLTGIVAHAISRVIYKNELEEPEIPDVPEKLDMKPQTFGKEILSALQNTNTATFGQEDNVPATRRGKASKSHIDALKYIASKSKSGDGKSPTSK